MNKVEKAIQLIQTNINNELKGIEAMDKMYSKYPQYYGTDDNAKSVQRISMTCSFRRIHEWELLLNILKEEE